MKYQILNCYYILCKFIICLYFYSQSTDDLSFFNLKSNNQSLLNSKLFYCDERQINNHNNTQ